MSKELPPVIVADPLRRMTTAELQESIHSELPLNGWSQKQLCDVVDSIVAENKKLKEERDTLKNDPRISRILKRLRVALHL